MADEQLLTKDELFADYDADPRRRARWAALALARAVAFAIERYRMEHKLSQRALAAKVGMKQPHIARLELGEHNPSIETLARLANLLGTRFVIDVAPGDQGTTVALSLPPGIRVVEDSVSRDGGRVLVATGEIRRRKSSASTQAACSRSVAISGPTRRSGGSARTHASFRLI